MDLILCSPNQVGAKQMLEQGFFFFLPGQGLGKEEYGIKMFESPKPHTENRGLWHFT